MSAGINFFRTFVRAKYHAMGLHQHHLAEAMGFDAATISRWLSGLLRRSDQDLEHLASWLCLSEEERSEMFLAHDLLYAGPRVQAYVAALERDRFGNEVCDQRIDKLRTLLDDLHFQRSSGAARRPILFRPSKPDAENTLPRPDDEETHGGGPVNG